MESYRLKNIAIVILLLLNLFLLLLVLSESYGRHQAARDLTEQTLALLEDNGISVSAALLKEETLPLPCAYERDEGQEASFARALLGEDAAYRSSGSSGTYTSALGTVSFRANGAVALTMTGQSLRTDNCSSFALSHAPAHYELVQTEKTDTGEDVTLRPVIGGFPVYGAALTFSFSDGCLAEVSGVFLADAPAQTSESSGSAALTKCAAAVHLMDDCNETGRVCNRITAISVGYRLQSTASVALLLSPVYQIDTNTYGYEVDAATGYVTLAR